MSAETFAIVLSAIGVVLTLGTTMLAGFAWCVRRIDAVDTTLTARIDAVDMKLTTRIDKLTTRIDAVADDVTELKIAVARFEGPARHLYVPGR
ncbi:hypothetical protein ACFY9N_15840 [Microbacterium sp. NPDC008134]|uniref:hypothetical protein n=1 Tax=Microbacterium sp. NPDC008134 TaxID=3364183 RepID=UPI0036EC3E1A